MTASFALRTPTAADAAGIARIHVLGWRQSLGGLLDACFFDDRMLRQRTDGWHAALSAPPDDRTFSVAALPDGSIAGFAASGPALDDDAPADRQLYMLYIAATAYGTGMGQALLDQVLPDPDAYLWVARDNPRARAFYARNGLVPDGTVKVDHDLDDLAEVRLVRRGADR